MSAGFGWRAFVDGLARQEGSLAAVAERLAAERHHQESVESIERGLRRLRGREGDGGVWGRRALRVFGLPDGVMQRLEWMGVYHSEFTDLPVPIALDLVRLWDRAPVRESSWSGLLHLAYASIRIRQGDTDGARGHLERVRTMVPIVQLELALVESFLDSRDDPVRSLRRLEDAEPLLSRVDDPCFRARWVDQKAWRLNRMEPRDPAGALALYREIDPSGPAFARCRRLNGMGWSLHRLGERGRALECARSAVAIAGDAGRRRLRAMALRLLSVVAEGPEAEEAARRSERIASDLRDGLLMRRFARE